MIWKPGSKSMVLVALAIVMSACGGGSPSTEVSPTSSRGAERPASTATIKIVNPAPGEMVQGSTYRVRVEVTGARVLEEASTDLKPDTGHVHLALDGKTVTLLAGLEFELKDLTPGQHLLQAEFAAADHGPFKPRVLDTVTFSVQ